MVENNVEVNEETYELLEVRAEEKGFDTTDEYINYVLDQVADKVRKKKEEEDNKENFSEEDEEKVKKRLKGLGYLD